ncbi:LamG domain-containing protein [Candidatus Pacearchaeota archaeon]|nr:LamG domain-containing protein [Candidatus Pacearchaeota archaeon]
MAILAGYKKRQPFSFASGGIGLSASLPDFMSAFVVPPGNPLWSTPPSDGRHIRLTASDGVTPLKFELEAMETIGSRGAWHLRMPSMLHTGDTDGFLYYDAITPSNGDDKEAVPDSDYEAVYRLNQDKPEGAYDDSTSNNHNALNDGTIDIAAQIDRGRDFDGLDDSIDIPDSAAWAFASNFAYEISLEPDDISAGRAIWSQTTDSNNRLYIYNSGGKVLFLVKDGGTTKAFYRTTNVVLANNTKAHVGVDRNTSTGNKIYINGSSVALDELTADANEAIPNFATSLQLGMTNNPGFENYFDGTMDEGTISNVSRSADWWAARNQSRLGAWLSFGAEESLGNATLRRRREGY